MLESFFRILRPDKDKDDEEIKKAQRDLQELDARAERDKEIRQNLNARLRAVQVDLDNLTRRGGNVGR